MLTTDAGVTTPASSSASFRLREKFIVVEEVSPVSLTCTAKDSPSGS